MDAAGHCKAWPDSDQPACTPCRSRPGRYRAAPHGAWPHTHTGPPESPCSPHLGAGPLTCRRSLRPPFALGPDTKAGPHPRPTNHPRCVPPWAHLVPLGSSGPPHLVLRQSHPPGHHLALQHVDFWQRCRATPTRLHARPCLTSTPHGLQRTLRPPSHSLLYPTHCTVSLA
jgi:hypothetical protein